MSETAPDRSDAAACGRRAVLVLALGAGLALPIRGRLDAQPADPRKQRPQANDRFVFADGERKGQVVTLVDLPAGSRPVAV